MLGEGCELQKLVGTLAEHLQLEEYAAVQLLECLKAASPSCYQCSVPWLFRVPLEEDHRDTCNGNACLHAEFLVQCSVQPLRSLKNPLSHLSHGFCGLLRPRACILP